MSVGGTPYDDIHRYISEDMKNLMIASINHIFGKRYGKNTDIKCLNNEVKSLGETFITDTCLIIGDGLYSMFIVENQSKIDKHMDERLAKYMLAHASSKCRETMRERIVSLPGIAVINLRGEQSFEPLKLVHEGGLIKDIEVHVLNLQKEMDIETIRREKLYGLVPFLPFTVEDNIRSGKGQTKIDSLRNSVQELLLDAVKSDDLIEDDYKELWEMYKFIERRLSGLSRDKSIEEAEEERKEEDRMFDIREYLKGASILTDEEKIAERKEGRKEGHKEMIVSMAEVGISLDKIVKASHLDKKKVKEILSMAGVKLNDGRI